MERITWWVIGTGREVERQELSGGSHLSCKLNPAAANSCPEPGDWKATRHGLGFSDWLGHGRRSRTEASGQLRRCLASPRDNSASRD